ncbi:MAG: hypothetical protein P8Z49_08380 [Acidobacteriota bacterium]
MTSYALQNWNNNFWTPNEADVINNRKPPYDISITVKSGTGISLGQLVVTVTARANDPANPPSFAHTYYRSPALKGKVVDYVAQF